MAEYIIPSHRIAVNRKVEESSIIHYPLSIIQPPLTPDTARTSPVEDRLKNDELKPAINMYSESHKRRIMKSFFAAKSVAEEKGLCEGLFRDYEFLTALLERHWINTDQNDLTTIVPAERTFSFLKDLIERDVLREVIEALRYTGVEEDKIMLLIKNFLLDYGDQDDDVYLYGGRQEIFNRTVEHLFFRNVALFKDKALLFKLTERLLEKHPKLKYLLFYAGMHEKEPLYNSDLFPLHRIFMEKMSKGKKRVLIVKNIKDGIGDELIKIAVLAQALLDLNPEIEITIFTEKEYLYNNKRVITKSVGSRPPYGTEEKFDMVIHYTDESLGERQNEDLERWVAGLEKDIYVRANCYTDFFVFKEISIGDKKMPFAYIRGKQVYTPVYRLCAELGLPFRYGTMKPGREASLFVGLPSDNRFWEERVIPGNIESRRVLIFNGFGGEDRRKGYTGSAEERERFKNRLEEIIKEGFFVILFPNDMAWGTTEEAKKVIELLSENDKNYVLIAPLPKEDKRLPAHLIHKAEGVITVEGGLAHLAYLMGKPLITLQMPKSGNFGMWFPVGADPLYQSALSNPDIERAGLSKNIVAMVKPGSAHTSPAREEKRIVGKKEDGKREEDYESEATLFSRALTRLSGMRYSSRSALVLTSLSMLSVSVSILVAMFDKSSLVAMFLAATFNSAISSVCWLTISLIDVTSLFTLIKSSPNILNSLLSPSTSVPTSVTVNLSLPLVLSAGLFMAEYIILSRDSNVNKKFVRKLAGYLDIRIPGYPEQLLSTAARTSPAEAKPWEVTPQGPLVDASIDWEKAQRWRDAHDTPELRELAGFMLYMLKSTRGYVPHKEFIEALMSNIRDFNRRMKRPYVVSIPAPGTSELWVLQHALQSGLLKPHAVAMDLKELRAVLDKNKHINDVVLIDDASWSFNDKLDTIAIIDLLVYDERQGLRAFIKGERELRIHLLIPFMTERSSMLARNNGAIVYRHRWIKTIEDIYEKLLSLSQESPSKAPYTTEEIRSHYASLINWYEIEEREVYEDTIGMTYFQHNVPDSFGFLQTLHIGDYAFIEGPVMDEEGEIKDEMMPFVPPVIKPYSADYLERVEELRNSEWKGRVPSRTSPTSENVNQLTGLPVSQFDMPTGQLVNRRTGKLNTRTSPVIEVGGYKTTPEVLLDIRVRKILTWASRIILLLAVTQGVYIFTYILTPFLQKGLLAALALGMAWFLRDIFYIKHKEKIGEGVRETRLISVKPSTFYYTMAGSFLLAICLTALYHFFLTGPAANFTLAAIVFNISLLNILFLTTAVHEAGHGLAAYLLFKNMREAMRYGLSRKGPSFFPHFHIKDMRLWDVPRWKDERIVSFTGPLASMFVFTLSDFALALFAMPLSLYLTFIAISSLSGVSVFNLLPILKRSDGFMLSNKKNYAYSGEGVSEEVVTKMKDYLNSHHIIMELVVEKGGQNSAAIDVNGRFHVTIAGKKHTDEAIKKIEELTGRTRTSPVRGNPEERYQVDLEAFSKKINGTIYYIEDAMSVIDKDWKEKDIKPATKLRRGQRAVYDTRDELLAEFLYFANELRDCLKSLLPSGAEKSILLDQGHTERFAYAVSFLRSIYDGLLMRRASAHEYIIKISAPAELLPPHIPSEIIEDEAIVQLESSLLAAELKISEIGLLLKRVHPDTRTSPTSENVSQLTGLPVSQFDMPTGQLVNRRTGKLNTRTSPKGPIGDSGGYLNKVIHEADQALAQGEHKVALAKAEEALGIFQRLDELQGDEKGLQAFLDELGAKGTGESDFKDKWRKKAEQIRNAAREAVHRITDIENATRPEQNDVLPLNDAGGQSRPAESKELAEKRAEFLQDFELLLSRVRTEARQPEQEGNPVTGNYMDIAASPEETDEWEEIYINFCVWPHTESWSHLIWIHKWMEGLQIALIDDRSGQAVQVKALNRYGRINFEGIPGDGRLYRYAVVKAAQEGNKAGQADRTSPMQDEGRASRRVRFGDEMVRILDGTFRAMHSAPIIPVYGGDVVHGIHTYLFRSGKFLVVRAASVETTLADVAYGLAQRYGFAVLSATYNVGTEPVITELTKAILERLPIVLIGGSHPPMPRGIGAKWLHATFVRLGQDVSVLVAKAKGIQVFPLYHALNPDKLANRFREALLTAIRTQTPVFVPIQWGVIDKMTMPLQPIDWEASFTKKPSLWARWRIRRNALNVFYKLRRYDKSALYVGEALPRRLGRLTEEVSERFGLFTTVSWGAKGYIREDLPTYGGPYVGEMSTVNPATKEYMESCNFVLLLGKAKAQEESLIGTGVVSLKFPKDAMAIRRSQRYPRGEDIELFLKELLRLADREGYEKRRIDEGMHYYKQVLPDDFRFNPDERITYVDLHAVLGYFSLRITDRPLSFVSCPSGPWFNGNFVPTRGHNASYGNWTFGQMGVSAGQAMAVALGKERIPIVLVGDGAFLMKGLSHLLDFVRLREQGVIKHTVFVVADNRSLELGKPSLSDSDTDKRIQGLLYDVYGKETDLAGMCEKAGAAVSRVKTKGELCSALEAAVTNEGVYVILMDMEHGSPVSAAQEIYTSRLTALLNQATPPTEEPSSSPVNIPTEGPATLRKGEKTLIVPRLILLKKLAMASDSGPLMLSERPAAQKYTAEVSSHALRKASQWIIRLFTPVIGRPFDFPTGIPAELIEKLEKVRRETEELRKKGERLGPPAGITRTSPAKRPQELAAYRRRAEIYQILEEAKGQLTIREITDELRRRGYKKLRDTTVADDIRLDKEYGLAGHKNLKIKKTVKRPLAEVLARRDAIFSILEKVKGPITVAQIMRRLKDLPGYEYVNRRIVTNDIMLDKIRGLSSHRNLKRIFKKSVVLARRAAETEILTDRKAPISTGGLAEQLARRGFDKITKKLVGDDIRKLPDLLRDKVRRRHVDLNAVRERRLDEYRLLKSSPAPLTVKELMQRLRTHDQKYDNIDRVTVQNDVSSMKRNPRFSGVIKKKVVTEREKRFHLLGAEFKGAVARLDELKNDPSLSIPEDILATVIRIARTKTDRKRLGMRLRAIDILESTKNGRVIVQLARILIDETENATVRRNACRALARIDKALNLGKALNYFEVSLRGELSDAGRPDLLKTALPAFLSVWERDTAKLSRDNLIYLLGIDPERTKFLLEKAALSAASENEQRILSEALWRAKTRTSPAEKSDLSEENINKIADGLEGAIADLSRVPDEAEGREELTGVIDRLWEAARLFPFYMIAEEKLFASFTADEAKRLSRIASILTRAYVAVDIFVFNRWKVLQGPNPDMVDTLAAIETPLGRVDSALQSIVQSLSKILTNNKDRQVIEGVIAALGSICGQLASFKQYVDGQHSLFETADETRLAYRFAAIGKIMGHMYGGLTWIIHSPDKDIRKKAVETIEKTAPFAQAICGIMRQFSDYADDVSTGYKNWLDIEMSELVFPIISSISYLFIITSKGNRIDGEDTKRSAERALKSLIKIAVPHLKGEPRPLIDYYAPPSRGSIVKAFFTYLPLSRYGRLQRASFIMASFALVLNAIVALLGGPLSLACAITAFILIPFVIYLGYIEIQTIIGASRDVHARNLMAPEIVQLEGEFDTLFKGLIDFLKSFENAEWLDNSRDFKEKVYEYIGHFEEIDMRISHLKTSLLLTGNQDIYDRLGNLHAHVHILRSHLDTVILNRIWSTYQGIRHRAEILGAQVQIAESNTRSRILANVDNAVFSRELVEECRRKSLRAFAEWQSRYAEASDIQEKLNGLIDLLQDILYRYQGKAERMKESPAFDQKRWVARLSKFSGDLAEKRKAAKYHDEETLRRDLEGLVDSFFGFLRKFDRDRLAAEYLAAIKSIEYLVERQGRYRFGWVTEDQSARTSPVGEEPNNERQGIALKYGNDLVNVNYRVRGDGEIPLILIHGLGESGNCWDKIIDSLTEKYRVYALDLPGFGYSDKPKVNYTITQYAGMVNDFLDKLKISRATLVGHSMGGSIAIIFSNNYREKVERIILINSTDLPLKAAAVKLLKIGYRIPGINLIVYLIIKYIMANSAQLRWQTLNRDAVPELKREFRQSSHRAVRQLVSILINLDLTGMLKRINVPTLVILGGRDPMRPPSSAEKLKGPTQYLELKIVESGHYAQLEKPEEVSDAILVFLSQVTPNPSGPETPSTGPASTSPAQDKPFGFEGMPTNKVVGMLLNPKKREVAKKELLKRALTDAYKVVNPLVGALRSHDPACADTAIEIFLKILEYRYVPAARITYKLVVALHNPRGEYRIKKLLLAISKNSLLEVLNPLMTALAKQEHISRMRDLVLEISKDRQDEVINIVENRLSAAPKLSDAKRHAKAMRRLLREIKKQAAATDSVEPYPDNQSTRTSAAQEEKKIMDGRPGIVDSGETAVTPFHYPLSIIHHPPEFSAYTGRTSPAEGGISPPAGVLSPESLKARLVAVREKYEKYNPAGFNTEVTSSSKFRNQLVIHDLPRVPPGEQMDSFVLTNVTHVGAYAGYLYLRRERTAQEVALDRYLKRPDEYYRITYDDRGFHKVEFLIEGAYGGIPLPLKAEFESEIVDWEEYSVVMADYEAIHDQLWSINAGELAELELILYKPLEHPEGPLVSDKRHFRNGALYVGYLDAWIDAYRQQPVAHYHRQLIHKPTHIAAYNGGIYVRHDDWGKIYFTKLTGLSQKIQREDLPEDVRETFDLSDDVLTQEDLEQFTGGERPLFQLLGREFRGYFKYFIDNNATLWLIWPYQYLDNLNKLMMDIDNVVNFVVKDDVVYVKYRGSPSDINVVQPTVVRININVADETVNEQPEYFDTRDIRYLVFRPGAERLTLDRVETLPVDIQKRLGIVDEEEIAGGLTLSKLRFIELLHILNRNWWLIQERGRPDGSITDKGYNDKLAFEFKKDRPDLAAVKRWGRQEFEDKKRIAADIINDRIRMGKLQFMPLANQQYMFWHAGKLELRPAGPARTSPAEGGGRAERKILDVPKIKQLPFHCGPASLSMVLAHHGINIDQGEIASMADLDPEDGVFPPRLAECARGLGYTADEFYGLSIPEAISIIRNKGIPLIARVKSFKREEGYAHLIVIKGYELNKRVLYINDPNDLARESIDFDSFEKRWVVDNYLEKRRWETKNYAISVRTRAAEEMEDPSRTSPMTDDAESSKPRHTADEMMGFLMGHGFYEALEKPEDLGKRAIILGKLQEKIDYAVRLFKDNPGIGEILEGRVLKRAGAGTWATFGAVVVSLKHITQRGGEDDYRLLYHDAEKDTLFIAKEILFELDAELAAEFLFLELSDGGLTKPQIRKLFHKENYTPEARKERGYTLDEYTRHLLQRRVLFYRLEELVDILLNRKAEMLSGSRFTDEHSHYYNTQIMDALRAIIKEKPRHLRSFIRRLKELGDETGVVAIDTLYKVLGEMGVWSTSIHASVKKMKINMENGDLAEFMYNFFNYILIRDHFLASDRYAQERWLLEEDGLLWEEHKKFITQTRTYVQEMAGNFKNHVDAQLAGEAKAVLDNLEKLRGDFPLKELLIEEETMELAKELSDTIDNMRRSYEDLLGRLGSKPDAGPAHTSPAVSEVSAIGRRMPLAAVFIIAIFVWTHIKKRMINFYLRRLLKPDGGAHAGILRRLSWLEGVELAISDNPHEFPGHVTIKDVDGHRHFVIDRNGNLIERYIHEEGRFREVTFRNVQTNSPYKRITLKRDPKIAQLYNIYIGRKKIGRVGYTPLPPTIDKEFTDISHIAIRPECKEYRRHGIGKSVNNIFAKWAKEAGKEFAAFDITNTIEAHILTDILINPGIPKRTRKGTSIVVPVTDIVIKILPKDPLNDIRFKETIPLIAGKPNPIYVIGDTKGNFIAGHESDLPARTSPARSEDEDGVSRLKGRHLVGYGHNGRDKQDYEKVAIKMAAENEGEVLKFLRQFFKGKQSVITVSVEELHRGLEDMVGPFRIEPFKETLAALFDEYGLGKFVEPKSKRNAIIYAFKFREKGQGPPEPGPSAKTSAAEATKSEGPARTSAAKETGEPRGGRESVKGRAGQTGPVGGFLGPLPITLFITFFLPTVWLEAVWAWMKQKIMKQPTPKPRAPRKVVVSSFMEPYRARISRVREKMGVSMPGLKIAPDGINEALAAPGAADAYFHLAKAWREVKIYQPEKIPVDTAGVTTPLEMILCDLGRTFEPILKRGIDNPNHHIAVLTLLCLDSALKDEYEDIKERVNSLINTLDYYRGDFFNPERAHSMSGWKSYEDIKNDFTRGEFISTGYREAFEALKRLADYQRNRLDSELARIRFNDYVEIVATALDEYEIEVEFDWRNSILYLNMIRDKIRLVISRLRNIDKNPTPVVSREFDYEAAETFAGEWIVELNRMALEMDALVDDLGRYKIPADLDKIEKINLEKVRSVAASIDKWIDVFNRMRLASSWFEHELCEGELNEYNLLLGAKEFIDRTEVVILGAPETRTSAAGEEGPDPDKNPLERALRLLMWIILRTARALGTGMISVWQNEIERHREKRLARKKEIRKEKEAAKEAEYRRQRLENLDSRLTAIGKRLKGEEDERAILEAKIAKASEVLNEVEVLSLDIGSQALNYCNELLEMLKNAQDPSLPEEIKEKIEDLRRPVLERIEQIEEERRQREKERADKAKQDLERRREYLLKNMPPEIEPLLRPILTAPTPKAAKMLSKKNRAERALRRRLGGTLTPIERKTIEDAIKLLENLDMLPPTPSSSEETRTSPMEGTAEGEDFAEEAVKETLRKIRLNAEEVLTGELGHRYPPSALIRLIGALKANEARKLPSSHVRGNEAATAILAHTMRLIEQLFRLQEHMAPAGRMRYVRERLDIRKLVQRRLDNRCTIAAAGGIGELYMPTSRETLAYLSKYLLPGIKRKALKAVEEHEPGAYEAALKRWGEIYESLERLLLPLEKAEYLRLAEELKENLKRRYREEFGPAKEPQPVLPKSFRKAERSAREARKRGMEAREMGKRFRKPGPPPAKTSPAEATKSEGPAHTSPMQEFRHRYEMSGVLKTIVNKTSRILGGKRRYGLSSSEASSRLISKLPFIGDQREFKLAFTAILKNISLGAGVKEAARSVNEGVRSWVNEKYGLQIPSLLEENYGLTPLQWDKGNIILGSLYLYNEAIAHIAPHSATGELMITDVDTNWGSISCDILTAGLATYILIASSPSQGSGPETRTSPVEGGPGDAIPHLERSIENIGSILKPIDTGEIRLLRGLETIAHRWREILTDLEEARKLIVENRLYEAYKKMSIALSLLAGLPEIRTIIKYGDIVTDSGLLRIDLQEERSNLKLLESKMGARIEDRLLSASQAIKQAMVITLSKCDPNKYRATIIINELQTEEPGIDNPFRKFLVFTGERPIKDTLIFRLLTTDLPQNEEDLDVLKRDSDIAGRYFELLDLYLGCWDYIESVHSNILKCLSLLSPPPDWENIFAKVVALREYIDRIWRLVRELGYLLNPLGSKNRLLLTDNITNLRIAMHYIQTARLKFELIEKDDRIKSEDITVIVQEFNAIMQMIRGLIDDILLEKEGVQKLRDRVGNLSSLLRADRLSRDIINSMTEDFIKKEHNVDEDYKFNYEMHERLALRHIIDDVLRKALGVIERINPFQNKSSFFKESLKTPSQPNARTSPVKEAPSPYPSPQRGEGINLAASIVIGVAGVTPEIQEVITKMEGKAKIGGIKIVALPGEDRVANLAALEEEMRLAGAYASQLIEGVEAAGLEEAVRETIKAIEESDKLRFLTRPEDVALSSAENIEAVRKSIAGLNSRLQVIQSLRTTELSLSQLPILEHKFNRIELLNRVRSKDPQFSARLSQIEDSEPGFKVIIQRVDELAALRATINEHVRMQSEYERSHNRKYPFRLHIQLADANVTPENKEKLLETMRLSEALKSEDITIALGDGGALYEIYEQLRKIYQDLRPDNIAIGDMLGIELAALGKKDRELLKKAALVTMSKDEGLASQLYAMVVEVAVNNNEKPRIAPEGINALERPNAEVRFYILRPIKPLNFDENRKEMALYEEMLKAV